MVNTTYILPEQGSCMVLLKLLYYNYLFFNFNNNINNNKNIFKFMEFDNITHTCIGVNC